jgi:hypothetical protein
MSNHTNRTQAHDFYYHGVDNGARRTYSGCTLNYDGCNALSYSTTVAKVIPAKGVKPKDVDTHRPSSGITLISMFSMSSTTGRHISYLHGASPFPVVEVPLERGDRDFSPQRLADMFAFNLDFYSRGLNLKANRDKFVGLLTSLRRIQADACDEWAKPLKKDKRLREYEGLDIAKACAERQELNRLAAAKAAAETRKVFAKYVKDKHGPDYCELIRTLFDSTYHSEKYPLTKEQITLLRKKIRGGAGARREPAYVWLAGDKVVTSQGVSVPVDEAKVAMRLWALGKDMRTMPIGMYQIVSYKGDTIQIGCHRIPRDNMLALYETVMGKPFPEKRTANVKGAE